MKGLFWRNGRLPWPLVISVIYVSAALIILDYIWRVVVMPFETLLIYAFLIDVGGAGLLIASWTLLGRRFVKKTRIR